MGEEKKAKPAPTSRNDAARLFGYDIFISFALGAPPRGTQSYASDLARRLRERDLTVFFSEDEAAPGDVLSPTLRTALHRSRLLVVVANRGTLDDPRWVRSEVEEFRAIRPARGVIPINVDGALQEPLLATRTEAWLGHADRIWLDESEPAVQNGLVSEAVLARLLRAPARMRSNVRWRWLVGIVGAGLVLLTGLSIGAAVYAVRQRDEAERANQIAQARSLAAQADLSRERGGAVDVSVLLAAEAVSQLSAAGRRSLEVDLALRRALDLLPYSLGQYAVRELGGARLQFSPTADFVTIGGSDGVSIRGLQVPSGEPRGCAGNAVSSRVASDGTRHQRFTLAASDSGDWCLVEGLDGTQTLSLEVWRSGSPEAIDRVTVESQAGHLQAAISNDGAWLASTDRAQSGEPSRSIVRLWSRASRAEVLLLQHEEFLRFSPDGRHFATSSGLWRLPDDAAREPVRVFSWVKTPWSIAFSPDGSHVAARREYDGEIEFYSVSRAQRAPLKGQPTPGSLLALGAGARFLVIYTGPSSVLWDMQTGTEIASAPIVARAAAFGAPDPTLLVEGAGENGGSSLRAVLLSRWGSALAGLELNQGERVPWLAPHGDEVDLLISSGDILRVETWNIQNGARHPRLSQLQPAAWAASADGRQVAIDGRGKLTVVTIGGEAPPIEIARTLPPSLLAFSRDGRYLATALPDGLAQRDLQSGQAWTSPPLGAPVAIQVSRDGAFAFALVGGEASRAGVAYRLMRWQMARPTELQTVALGRHLRPPALCFVSDDGLYIQLGDTRKEIATTQAVDLTDGDIDKCPPPAGQPLDVVTDDTHVMVSDARTHQLLARLDHPTRVSLAAASLDGKRVATVDEGGVRVFTLDSRELIDMACRRRPREFDADEWRRYFETQTVRDACGRARPPEVGPAP